jgi:hypothetical protein
MTGPFPQNHAEGKKERVIHGFAHPAGRTCPLALAPGSFKLVTAAENEQQPDSDQLSFSSVFFFSFFRPQKQKRRAAERVGKRKGSK